MRAYFFSTIIFTIILIAKVVIAYLEGKDNFKDKIKNIRNKIDKFFDKNYRIIFIVFAILIFFSRIYKFGEVPKSIGVDEAGAAYDAYTLANYGVDRYLNSYPLYLINFGGGQSVLYAYATIPFIKLFGANLITYRLPELLFYLMGIVVSYILVNKLKNKKMALLYAFLIIICPWNIEASREGLDCNLLAPMFMLDLLLLLTAKKDWHYAIAGISIGITLYTYALSWMLIPAFLITYIIYMLYLKKITIKQIIFLGIPIFIFAIPLMYSILLNHNIVNKTQFGIFTIPKLPIYRESEISILNIFRYGFESIRTIFFERHNKLTIYFIEVPMFLIGYVVGIKELVKSIKEKKFKFSGFIILIFTILLITNLLVKVTTSNKANILFFLILYITAMGISSLSKKAYTSGIIIIITLLIAFTNFEINYYNNTIHSGLDRYKDNGIMEITEEIDKEKEPEKYIITKSVVQPYIYTLVQNKISPYDFDFTKNMKHPEILPVIIKSYDKYNFEISIEDLKEIKDNINNKKYIIAIEKTYEDVYNYLLEIGFKKQEKENYFILKNY